MARKQKQCMAKDCKRKAVSRGVCHSCYQNARNLVNQEKTTWKKLEEQGIVLPSEGGGGRSPLRKQFEEANGV